MFDQVAADLARRFRRAQQQGEHSKERKELTIFWANVIGPEGEVSKGHMDGASTDAATRGVKFGTCIRTVRAGLGVSCGLFRRRFAAGGGCYAGVASAVAAAVDTAGGLGA